MKRWDAAAGVWRGAACCEVCKSYMCLGDPDWCERERTTYVASLRCEHCGGHDLVPQSAPGLYYCALWNWSA